MAWRRRPYLEKGKPLGAFAEIVDQNGDALLSAVTGPGAPAWLREVPSFEVLRRIWVQDFCRLDDDIGPSQPDKARDGALDWKDIHRRLRWLASPHIFDVYYVEKRQTTWIGYWVRQTETCEPRLPNQIIHVETTTAPVVDRDVLGEVHAALRAEDLRPERHLVDAVYIEADGLVARHRDHGSTLVGPPLDDNQGQARTEDASPHQTVHPRLGSPPVRRARRARAGSQTPTVATTTSASGSH